MNLRSGTRLGPYEILAAVGAGGFPPPLPAGEFCAERHSNRFLGIESPAWNDAPLNLPSPPGEGRGATAS